jgi:hypothetical protein
MKRLSKMVVCTMVVGLGLVGCGYEGVNSAGSGDAASASDGSSGIRDSFKVTWGPVAVAPGIEDTRCITAKVGNSADIKVHQVVNKLSSGSHHLIVYRDNGANAENLTPTPCQPFAGTLQASANGAVPIMISQRVDDTLTLPAGVAYTFKSNQFVRIEMHFINATDSEQMVTGTSEFRTIDPAQFQNEADFLFIGSPDIDLAPGQTKTLNSKLKVPSTLSGVNVFAITGHTHKLGTDMQVGLRTAAGQSVTSLYKPNPFSWDEPETATYPTPVVLNSGSSFEFSCEWNNTTADTVGFGESATDEMCFFWAYYYPAKGAKVCAHTEQVPGGLEICCPDAGVTLCSQILK